MKKEELMKLYGSIKASDSFKEKIYSDCTGRRIKIIPDKHRTVYSIIAAAAVFAVIIGGGAAFVIADRELLTPAENAAETVDIIEEEGNSLTEDSEEEQRRKIEEQQKITEEKIREEELQEELCKSQEEQLRQREEELRRRHEEEIRQRQEEEEKAKAQEISGYEVSGEEVVSQKSGIPQLIWPCPTVKSFSETYSTRTDDGEGNARDFHKGIDITGTDCEGEPIVASASGTVLTASDTGSGYGIHVVIDHGNDLITIYGHMSECCVSVGDKVEQGQTIGYIGSTGYAYEAQCHFEVRKDFETVDPFEYIEK